MPKSTYGKKFNMVTKQNREASDLGPTTHLSLLAVIKAGLIAFLGLWLTDRKMSLRFTSL